MLFDFRLKHHESHVNIISCDIVSSEHKSNLDLVAKRSDTGIYIYIYLFIDFKGRRRNCYSPLNIKYIYCASGSFLLCNLSLLYSCLWRLIFVRITEIPER